VSEYRELLIGCGHARDKRIALPGQPLEWKGLTTLDCCPECNPDWLWNLQDTPWCAHGELYEIKDSTFDEVHAYEVLEHLGQQGDAVSFFEHFSEIWRILKPGGYLFATCPSRYSAWLWGDPSHRRAILKESLVFLDQTAYRALGAGNPMSDFRHIYKADFKIFSANDNHVNLIFCLQAQKPPRCT
jgi:SAM-dependent methyltransferase